ncbi:dihydroxyacetone kinase Dak1 [Exophiala xenobiotica]|uniref:Dihydroxyacetone kinase Dak1 n=1 Tax=Vermiconidia calcicola TaxID=1690605 RepID=A0AAV9QDX5_9PEZI|nr:dihydroxyacetone kinase Dak1 [Exophiala xenobiotica]KAK5539889.1 dihydroxyacetone kinase Dak1 [Vermiconidia calcicola]KAK5210981.1 dihydroxyacetone kinase Dak1 [Exophiala xenobiotica]KAK5381730.1 dihydroxyacetone kinase Dak1 [Exophiala xenobiotica]KAK5422096.1 dihydroxyacetone kinase Dak1 [Exophiala xenobiotica]
MQTKHFIDDPTHLVHTALKSLTLTNPSVALDAENKIIYRRPTKEQQENPKVSVITGGGSGRMYSVSTKGGANQAQVL